VCARALWVSELPPVVLVLLLLAVTAIAVLDHREHCRVSTLYLDACGTWHLEHDGRACISGKLLDAGTRGARTLTLVFERVERTASEARAEGFDHALTRGLKLSTRWRLQVHADSIGERDFSFLHYQLMLAGDSNLPFSSTGTAT